MAPPLIRPACLKSDEHAVPRLSAPTPGPMNGVWAPMQRTISTFSHIRAEHVFRFRRSASTGHCQVQPREILTSSMTSIRRYRRALSPFLRYIGCHRFFFGKGSSRTIYQRDGLPTWTGQLQQGTGWVHHQSNRNFLSLGQMFYGSNFLGTKFASCLNVIICFKKVAWKRPAAQGILKQMGTRKIV